MKRLLILTVFAMTVSTVAMADDSAKERPFVDHRAEQRIGMMFRNRDTDRDGTISKNEFLKVAEERFAKIDADSDGKITKEEMQKHVKEMGNRFKRMGQNRSGNEMPRDRR